MNPDSWSKQDWIKDVLSKSGTDILEIKEEKSKEICKMVYYPSLPLIMKSETKQQQLCSQLSNETQIYQNGIGLQQHQQQQQMHHSQHQGAPSSVQNSNTLLIPSSQSFLHSIKLEPQQQQHQQAQNLHVEQNNSNSNISISNQQNALNKMQFKCEQCNMIFGSKSAHTSHMKSHIKQDNNYQTSSAPVMPSSTQVTTTTGSDPYQCNVCQKTFAVPARLIRHYRTHTGERPFECEFCHKTFSVKENLQVHRRIHTKERPYKCDVCDRAFEHSGKLHRHMRIHTGERPHKCSVCDKTFIQSGQLVIHMRTHTGEKPYKCPVEGCGKGFTCSKQLKVHSRTHTGEKPYHCDICFRDFGYNHVLKLHRVQHYGSKCYKCTICDETFKSKKEMEAHIKGHANEIPDDDDEQQQQQPQQPQQQQQQQQQPQQQNIKRETSPIFREPIPETEKIRDSIATSTAGSIHMETGEDRAVESNTELNSDNGDEPIYNNIYQRFEHNGVSFSLQPTRGSINPALLAAASIASRRVEETNKLRLDVSSSTPNVSQEPSGSSELNEYYKAPSSSAVQNRNTPSPAFVDYSTLDSIRQRSYFAPAPVAEFRSSLRTANDIVRQVEAAIAGAEPLLTPPRSSSTESPERSSSPESDSMMMADRDVMTLPLRKRKLYLKDNQTNDVPPVMRMNSVIQFAKAS